MSIEARFGALSPRLNPKPFTALSLTLHGGAVILLALLVAQAFQQTGLLSWVVGLAYVLYDTFLIGFTVVRTWSLRRLVPVAEHPDLAHLRLAVLLAAHDEQEVLVSTIAAMVRQESPPDIILVADDGSTDDTPLKLKAAFNLECPELGELSVSPVLPSLRWLRLPHGGKARALNAALELVDCDVVLTVDADTHLEPGAIAAMRAAFGREPSLVAATGVLVPVCDGSLKGRIFESFQFYEYVRNFISRFAWMQVGGLLLISGAFAGFRRSAVLAVGGFDPECMVEDYELIHRLHRQSFDHGLGWKVRVLGEARATTDAPADVSAFLRQRRRWFGGFLQTQYWNRDMVGSGRFGRLGTMMLPVKAFDAVQPLYGLAAFAILVFFLATSRFDAITLILLVMLAKIAIDLAAHIWFLNLYRQWTGAAIPRGSVRLLLHALMEPVSFQLLRHVGAALGWLAFLSGRVKWGQQQRKGLIAWQMKGARELEA